MFDVSAATLAGIVARPETFLDVYGSLGGSGSTPLAFVQSQLGSQFASLTDPGAIATFASAVSFNVAPLAATPLDPQAATMQQLLNSSALTCGHFCKLTTLFALLANPQMIPPDPDGGPATRPSVHFLVWLPNVPLKTGNHAQLVISNVLEDAYLLLDPTYAYALRIPFVGAGPQASLSPVVNAATMLQTPIAKENLAILDSTATSATPDMLTTVLSGALNPSYVYHDSIYGCEGWDNRIALIFDNFG